MTEPLIRAIVERHLQPAGLYLYGFARLEGLLPSPYEKYASGISIVRRLDDDILDGIVAGPTPEYLAHYEEINRVTQALAGSIAGELTDEGVEALAIKPTVLVNLSELDAKDAPLRYDISHKMVATRAGLGWIGKTDLFVSKKFGTRIRLISILLKTPVTPGYKPVDRSRCGRCSVCVEVCPAGAATGQLWDIHTDRDLFFDARKCRDQCTEFGRTRLKLDRKICGLCVAVCPIGRKKPSADRLCKNLQSRSLTITEFKTALLSKPMKICGMYRKLGILFEYSIKVYTFVV